LEKERKEQNTVNPALATKEKTFTFSLAKAPKEDCGKNTKKKEYEKQFRKGRQTKRGLKKEMPGEVWVSALSEQLPCCGRMVKNSPFTALHQHQGLEK